MLSLPELDINSRSKLVEALFSCDCMKSLQSRSRVIQKLPSEIQQKISAGGNNKQDVDDTLDSCLQFEDGMERLLEVVKYYEGNSFAWQKRVCPTCLTARSSQSWRIMDRPAEIRDGLVNLERVLTAFV